MPTVTIHEAKTNLSKLIAAVERGEQVVIKRGAKPVAQLVPPPIPDDQPGWRLSENGDVEILHTGRRFGALKGLVALDETFWDPLPEEELALWEGRGDDPLDRA